MAFIDWNESYSVSFQQFDQQHQILINLINRLYDVIKEQKSDEELEKIYLELTHYTKTHFHEEETWLKELNFPYTDNHIFEHKNLIKQLETLHEELRADKALMGLKTMNFLKTWLNNHILRSDKKYGEFYLKSMKNQLPFA